jgi:hypothetical protein
MIEMQAKRAYWALGQSGDYRNFEIDLGFEKGVFIAWCNGVAIVDYKNKRRCYKKFNNLQKAQKFAFNWFAKNFPHLI